MDLIGAPLFPPYLCEGVLSLSVLLLLLLFVCSVFPRREPNFQIMKSMTSSYILVKTHKKEGDRVISPSQQ